MLNSRNYTREDGVLNSGEKLAPETNLKDPDTKIYYHRTPGAKTHLEDGTEVQFMGGQFATANPEVKRFLDKIADKQGTQVYTKKTEAVSRDHAVAATDAALPAGDSKNLLEGRIPQASPEMTAKVDAKPEAPDVLPGQTAIPTAPQRTVVPAVPTVSK